MPGIFALTGVISTTPRFRCLAISFNECPADLMPSNIIRSSRFILMKFIVSFTVLLSTPATRAIRIGGISISFRYIFPFLMLSPFSTRMRATLSLSGWFSRCFFMLFHMFRFP